MWNSTEIKSQGKAAFKLNYWPCVFAAIILSLSSLSGSGSGGNTEQTINNSDAYMTTTSVFAMLIAFAVILALAIFVFNPLMIGARRFFLVNILHPARLDHITQPFKTGYSNIVKGTLMKDIQIVLLTLCLIVPGVVRAYQLRMVDYILSENPELNYREAFIKSEQMMMGNKMDAFMYDLSYIGWYILTIFTAGILGVFWVGPYKASSDAALYIAIRNISGVMSSDNNDSKVSDVEFEVESND